MNFGLQATDIIEAFSQAVSGNFATNGTDGYTIINNEIEFQSEKLLALLGNRFTLEIVDEVVKPDDLYTFTPALTVDENSTLKARFSDSGLCNSKCYTKQPCDPDWIDVTDNMDGTYTTVDTGWDRCTKTLLVTYDASESSFRSLRSILKHMVCEAFGNVLFPVTNSDEWSVTRYHAKEAQKWMELIEKGWVPSELKKVRFLNSRFSTIVSIPSRRY
jgi:hypothetical protein